MTSPNIEARFWKLVEEARRIDLESDDQRVCEPSMIQVIELVQSHPEHRAFFIGAFAELVEGAKPSMPDFLPFCMRSLRMPEVIAAVNADMRRRKEGTSEFARRMDFYSDMFHAYQDAVWKDADLWPFYAHELQKKNA
jgi:hypothetical protein